ncbi:MAG: competence/damage-inducible protein A [Elusimicrobia bacterium]|nr:competence/damage-inducible protein A [Elusimicrobiota bacterium]
MGTELLMGKVNTHGAYLSRQLERLGLGLLREVTVGDDAGEMRRVFAEAWRRSDIVISTGGLGPTFDDITRDVWAKVLRRPLRFHPHVFQRIEAGFRARGLRMPEENRRQAFVLAGARVLQNGNGTAPGQVLRVNGKILALFPGPGRELWPMVEGQFLPFLARAVRPAPRRTRVYRIFGVPESVVDERLRPLIHSEDARKDAARTWGILAEKGIVDIKITVSASGRARADAALRRIHRKILREFSDEIYGFDEEKLEGVVGRLLRRNKDTLAVSESCTGGLLAEKITRVPGSSGYFLEGYVTYSNESKRRILGVRRRTLQVHGAVSEACALEMAKGCRRRSRADWALAVTGIAGPGGGTTEKPVGRVYFALSGPSGADCRWKQFHGARDQIRENAALFALNWLRQELNRQRAKKP